MLNVKTILKDDSRPLHGWISPWLKWDQHDLACWCRAVAVYQICTSFSLKQPIYIRKLKVNFKGEMIEGVTYLAAHTLTWKAPLACSDSSQTEFAKVFPNDWNKAITEGSHTLTSSVSDLTCKETTTAEEKMEKPTQCTNINVITGR